MMTSPINQILQGDALTKLKELESESVDCICTSPPYWALRDYRVDGQIGVEKTIDEYISNLIQIFNEAKRVLKKTGTCFVVLGDTYAGTGHKGDYKDPKYENGRNGQEIALNNKIEGIPQKSLCLIPERFAIAMIDKGWILRNKIIWHKKNCMPSSAKDRFTIDYEFIYFFSKSQKYYFKTQYEPFGDKPRWGGAIMKIKPEHKQSTNGYGIPAYERKWHSNPLGRIKRSVWTINTKPFSEAHFAVFPEELVRQCLDAGCPSEICIKCKKPRVLETKHLQEMENGKREIRKGDTTKPYAVQEREGIVSYRKLPDIKKFAKYINDWRKKEGETIEYFELVVFGNQAPHHWFNGESFPSIEDWKTLRVKLDIPDDNPFEQAMTKEYFKPAEKMSYSNYNEIGLSDCGCNAGFESGICLDMFMGSGTTALVALKHNRRFVGIELNGDYIKIAMKRLERYLYEGKLTNYLCNKN